MADLLPGYNVVTKLGDGARSAVYEVIHVATGKLYTLKRVTREANEDDRFLQQAINEFNVSQRLNHPTLRRSIELFKTRRLFKLVQVRVLMEFVDGLSLDRRRPDRLDELLTLFIQIAEGLGAMHQAGFLHTDIKPTNVIVAADGAIKIIDFGQSCPIGHRKPRIQGTPDYIAPEQVERRSLSQQTDVFNLGATLYWALTGQTYPTLITRHGRTRGTVASSAKPPPAPLDLDPTLPPALSRLVMACCAYDREVRPRDMAEVRGRLSALLPVAQRLADQASRQKSEPAAVPDVSTPTTALPPTSDDSLDYSAISEIINPHHSPERRSGPETPS
ncbi:MAG: hypothetical protein HBSAPP02_20120 [Phycisphaerae bacterium]|nr:MAG: serine/threonine protein kinase [Planctomycetia bacterium]RIK70330.1 MAG: hypothetical protein DCC66_05310 [Planctomycetota bacterium]GJQ26980.1 MAG: hypothetical protein HBSAPP02_20120 [Phycisphaerae bacterium]